MHVAVLFDKSGIISREFIRHDIFASAKVLARSYHVHVACDDASLIRCSGQIAAQYSVPAPLPRGICDPQLIRTWHALRKPLCDKVVPGQALLVPRAVVKVQALPL